MGEVAAGYQEHTSGSDEQQLQPALVSIAHGGDSGASRNEMERLLAPGLSFRGFHIGHVAGEPVQELDSELCFEHFGINATAHSANDVDPVRFRSFQPLAFPATQAF